MQPGKKVGGGHLDPHKQPKTALDLRKLPLQPNSPYRLSKNLSAIPYVGIGLSLAAKGGHRTMAGHKVHIIAQWP